MSAATIGTMISAISTDVRRSRISRSSATIVQAPSKESISVVLSASAARRAADLLGVLAERRRRC